MSASYVLKAKPQNDLICCKYAEDQHWLCARQLADLNKILISALLLDISDVYTLGNFRDDGMA